MPESHLVSNDFLRSSPKSQLWFNANCSALKPEYKELSLAEIFSGKDQFPGLFAIMRKFM